MKRLRSQKRQAGFTLIELTVSVLVLVIVIGAVFARIDSVQKVAKTEATKLDQTQESREFVDQFVRDIHMSGYPISTIFQNNPALTTQTQFAANGLVYASPTSIRFEGDVYGDGNVYSVLYTYYATDPNTPPDPNCPCLRRSVTLKQQGDPISGQLTPQYYTEVQNLVNTTGVFTYSDALGNAIDLSTLSCTATTERPSGSGCADIDTAADVGTLQKIDAIRVDVSTVSKQADMQTGQKIVLSLSSIAELEN